jgi:hypothetical protein
MTNLIMGGMMQQAKTKQPIVIILIASIALIFPTLAMASKHGGSGSSGHSSGSHSSSHKGSSGYSSSSHTSNYAEGVQRDANGKIARSTAAKDEFKKKNPCPVTPCTGYVIDHIDPLKSGGADAPSNMQWQTSSEAKAKDKVEGVILKPY